MTLAGIEEVLGFKPGELGHREEKLKNLGENELERRFKKYSNNPWNFLIYLAFNYPEQFERITHAYSLYDQSSNSEKIIEELKDCYVTRRIMSRGISGQGKIA